MNTLPGSLIASKSATSDAPPAIFYNEGKGHVSINPVYGCRIGCPFCINLADPFRPEGPATLQVPIASVEAILDELEQNAEQLRHLKLSLLDFGDPFDTKVRPLLRALLEGIHARLPGQIVLITTRLHPGRAVLDWIRSLENLPISMFVSLGDAAGGVRPVTPVAPRMELLEDCRNRGLHTVMLLKPLVPEWTTDEGLRILLRHASSTCQEVVMAGLTLEGPIEASLTAAGWPVPAGPRSVHGAVDPVLRERVLEIAATELGDVPLSEHRSCAINRHRQVPCLVYPGRVRDGETPKVRMCLACVGTVGMAGPDDRRPRDAQGYCWMKKAA